MDTGVRSSRALQDAPIFSLPSEVAEFLVVLLADYPTAIAALVQTCRFYRTLVYDTPDDHLWRSIFLAIYDDPRARLHVQQPPSKTEWGKEYRRRVWACGYLRRQHSDVGGFGDALPSGEDRTSAALEAIISLVAEAKPLSPHLIKDETKPSTASQQTKDGKPESLIRAHRRAPSFPPCPPESEKDSRNMIAYCDVVRHGVPLHIASQLFPEAKGGRELYQYIAFNGLTTSHDALAAHGLDVAQTPVSTPVPPHRNIAGLGGRVVKGVRKKVYDMSYPHLRRMFGPFVRVPAVSPRPRRSCNYTPDWQHLAYIRLVVQEALIEEFAADNGSVVDIPIIKPAALRGGRWLPLSVIPDSVALSGASAERDWAGVTGLWRKFVIWYGYETLLELNIGGFDNEILDDAFEVRATVPIRLRIASYIHNDGSPEAFPTIVVEGETGGEGWRHRDENDPNEDGDRRFVDGSVSMLHDGSVRWSMCTYWDASKRERQWASEGVQLGGTGSTAGIIGMWTGAQHEEGDPIGAWWQWRVE